MPAGQSGKMNATVAASVILCRVAEIAYSQRITV